MQKDNKMPTEEDIPDEVYHYTKKDTALKKILSGRKIKFGLLGLTNDPKESKLRQTSLITIGPIYYDPVIESQVNTESERILKQEWKVLCMTKNSDFIESPNSNQNEIMHKFRYGYNRPRMWAQYAENHSGVCLIFDGEKLHTNIENALTEDSKLFSGLINYENFSAFVPQPMEFLDLVAKSSDPIKFSETIRTHYSSHYIHYFLSKFPDWQGESEYRWLIHNNSNEEIFVNIEGALKSVIVGSDFPEDDEAEIITICKELQANVGKMSWINGLPNPSLDCLYKYQE